MSARVIGGKTIIGPTELVDFPAFNIKKIPARIDTGAQTSSLWASNINISGDKISFTFFDTTSEYYTGEVIEVNGFKETVVISSVGKTQKRYKVEIIVGIAGHKIKSKFTLSNRSTQVYPILIGRNTLRGRFVVDVKADILLELGQNKRAIKLQKLQNKIEGEK